MNSDFTDCACSGRNLGRLVQPAVMALLAHEPLHGYLIVQRLGQMPMFAAHPPDPAGVYRLLKSMEEDGFLTATVDASDSGPAKRRFELSADGRACLERWRQSLQDYSDAIADLLNDIKRAGVRAPSPAPPSPRVLRTFTVDGQTIDALDLKVLLLTQGISVDPRVYASCSATHRISADPLECNALCLPGRTVVHISDIGQSAPFHLTLGPADELRLLHRGQFVTEVTLPPATDFYRQTTSRGTPYRGMAVLQGYDVLTFPYLWPCDFAKAGMACRFCHCGNRTQQQWAAGIHEDIALNPREVAEIVRYAVSVEGCARHIQLTGGSSFNANGECGRTIDMLRAIDEAVGLGNIPGEIIVYTTPPADVNEIDRLFDAGVSRVACDLELWDEDLLKQICPGKSQWTGRQRCLDTLLHIAQTHGRGKAISTFVVGLELAESFLGGAEFLARNGIVPIPSIWMPHGLPLINGAAVPELDFYRRIRRGLATIYAKYDCQPPGDAGFNVCLCRDTWNHREAIVASI